MARTRLVETVWGQPDLKATYPPIKPDNVPLPPGGLGDLAARVDELIGTTFILEETDDYPPMNEIAWVANWVKDSGELAGFVAGTPQLVFVTLDYLAGLTEAKTGKVIERPWRSPAPIA